MDREALGKFVRDVWVAYCLETGDTKPSHIAPWEELSEWDKEADRRIGERLWIEGALATHEKWGKRLLAAISKGGLDESTGSDMEAGRGSH